MDPALFSRAELLGADDPAAGGGFSAIPEPQPLSTHGPATVLSMCNQKGGVGKTTSSINIGGALSQYGRRVLIVDFKSGYRSFHHRDDLRFYALVQTLRHGVPPRKLVTYYLDYAESETEDVTEGTLQSALARALGGVERHVELTVEGRPPDKRPGVACRWCPLREECDEGRSFLREAADEA